MKNLFKILGDITLIYILRLNGTRYTTIIDTEDLQKLKNYTIGVKVQAGYVYAYASYKGIQTRLNRFILPTDPWLEIDHINSDTLDNRKENLRACTKAQNGQNRRLHKNNTSGYAGISWFSNYEQWAVNIQLDNKRVFLGYFTELSDAKMAISTFKLANSPYSKTV